jgi:hypothetical protein
LGGIFEACAVTQNRAGDRHALLGACVSAKPIYVRLNDEALNGDRQQREE